MVKIFLLRSVCGNFGTFDANTIQEVPADYAKQLKAAKLARTATKEDAEDVQRRMLASPMREQAVAAAQSGAAPKRKAPAKPRKSAAKKPAAKKQQTSKAKA